MKSLRTDNLRRQERNYRTERGNLCYPQFARSYNLSNMGVGLSKPAYPEFPLHPPPLDQDPTYKWYQKRLAKQKEKEKLRREKKERKQRKKESKRKKSFTRSGGGGTVANFRSQ
ncbi:hypothetical protein CC78DRAFT_544528 [Lojkania enalia]|uniref:Uncharacterized protein n=1 Tax=Lojkania enalia TaxID=147567 RepID=A0A9P4KDB7_9PLEO|nr:hypothetical protein CC78DRAFT_544528 [Didymosphaeria enalia]